MRKKSNGDGFGRKPELVWLPTEKLSVDPKYQRETSSRRSRNTIEKIANDFRWSRFGVLLVVKFGNGWRVIDGQHRVEAARLKGIDMVPCVVRAYGRTPGAINARAIRETAKMLGFGRVAAAALQKGAKVRDCLSCGKPFLSESNGNRRCSGCKETDAVAA